MRLGCDVLWIHGHAGIRNIYSIYTVYILRQLLIALFVLHIHTSQQDLRSSGVYRLYILLSIAILVLSTREFTLPGACG